MWQNMFKSSGGGGKQALGAAVDGAVHHDKCYLAELRDDWSNHSASQHRRRRLFLCPCKHHPQTEAVVYNNLSLYSQWNPMIEEAEELCEASATSLFSAFTAAVYGVRFFWAEITVFLELPVGALPPIHLTLNSWVHVGGFCSLSGCCH